MQPGSKMKQMRAAILALSSLAFVQVNTAQAQQAREPIPLRTAPLPRNVPNARLGTRSGRRQRLDPRLATIEVSHDLRTGRTTLSPLPADQMYRSMDKFAQEAGDLMTPGSLGANGLSDIEPNKRDDDSINVQKVFGNDDRDLILNTTVYPWSTQCRLSITFPDGWTTHGSGTLIQRKYLLTAGHCVYSQGDGGWATSIRVVPGKSGASEPFGDAYATNLRTYLGWLINAGIDDDFGLVTLNRNIGDDTGWLGYGTLASPLLVMSHIAGYPGDLLSGFLYHDSDPIQNATSTRLFYWIDTYNGQSGSGIYMINKFGVPYVFGVHTGGDETFANWGTRIDATKYNSIQYWISLGN